MSLIFTHIFLRMITLIRPLISTSGDRIERRLKDMRAAYEVVNKDLSEMLYLIEDGLVICEYQILRHLDDFGKNLLKQNVVDSDSREIG